MITVLLTGGGAPGVAGTIYALKKWFKNELRLVVVDAREDVVGKYMADSFHKVPKATDEDFIPAILEIAKREKVDVIIPQVTKELLKFAKSKEEFEKRGVKVIVMDEDAIEIANNKYELLRTAERLGFPQGKFRLISGKKELMDFAKEIGYPEKNFVVKLPVSNGMRGLRIVTPQRFTLQTFINEKPKGELATLNEVASLFDQGSLELLCMEYYPGPEFTVDVYKSPLSGRVIAIPRRRDVIRTGITFEGTVMRREDLIEMSKRLANEIGMIYSFGFQFKIDENDFPKLLESNPRIQGTMIAAVMAGANMIAWSVEEALGREIDLENVRVDWNLKFKRYWGGIGIGERLEHIDPFTM